MTIPHHPVSTHVYRSVPLLSSYVLVKEAGALDYNPCHFYLVYLGEVFQDSYEVIAKLGYSDNSTVWLARDLLCYRFPEDRYVTLKFCRTDPPHRAATKRELTLSTERRVRGCWHTMLVYEPMHEPLWLFQCYRLGSVYPPTLLKMPVRMLLCALDYLHTESDHSHWFAFSPSLPPSPTNPVTPNVDIKPENILLTLKSAALLDTFAADEAAQPSPCKILGDRSIYLSRNDFGPLHALPKFLRVSDFDVAPDDFRVLEVMLGRA
ncbi:hypothetical protein NEOLEDRAFT_1183924 [Neolentinus lepideus HHB14362 ss-1]|uniref:non-specific serine/threonine protein kinase n=1 Tax=Neolentinus lepideus HHB14362 ss-1 TaxID=1314782 RepID=A0A165MW88_9AGAM|nr:hypothetical protein NEOLEDRAFT_1183924 [Neolentinus lepideus HHB14362 ss-1]